MMKFESIVLFFFLLLVCSCTDREAITNSLETEIDTHSIQFKFDKFRDAKKEAKKNEKTTINVLYI